MSGRRSRDRRACIERAVVRLPQAQGQATQGSRAWAWCAGSEPGVDRAVEVKCRGAGFCRPYDWLNNRDVPIVKADRQEPLAVLRMSLAAEIAKRTV
jgi:hypothetical protein